MSNFFKIVALLCVVALSSGASIGKVHPDLLRSLRNKHTVNILVTMALGTESVLNNLSRVTYANRGEKATAVFQSLTAYAAETQMNVLEMLKSPKYFAMAAESLWITNQVYIKGADKALVEQLATMEEVGSIAEEVIIQLDEPEADPTQDVGRGPMANEWGVEKIQAPQVWATGNNGQGAVIGIIDTGVRGTHEALRENYRGGAYSWYNPLVANSQNPVDGNGHGTHCTGTICGIGGIGVAPRAKWIACKGLSDFGSGASSDLIKCAQFMACPHEWNGNNPNCHYAPHAVSNSWGGAGGRDVYDGVIRAWHAADITPVMALGNSGPTCHSAGHPGDSRSGVIGVGASNDQDGIASFSSRGPSAHGELKPEIVAPGNNVRSSDMQSDSAYSSKSGTSMACPHVAGLVALARAQNVDLPYDELLKVITGSTDKDLVFTGEACLGVPDSEFPNYKFGHGRVNAFKTCQAIPPKD